MLLGSSAPVGAQKPAERPGWQLSWADEFDGPDGSAPDPTKWSFEVGGGGYGNHELETYTWSSRHARKT